MKVKIVHNLFIGPRCPWGPIYRSGSLSLTEPLCADLTDVTLADEDTNSILTDNASGALWWTILQLMQVAPSGGQSGIVLSLNLYQAESHQLSFKKVCEFVCLFVTENRTYRSDPRDTWVR